MHQGFEMQLFFRQLAKFVVDCSTIDMTAFIEVAILLHDVFDQIHLEAANLCDLAAHLLVVEEDQNIAEIKKNSAFHILKDTPSSLKKISERALYNEIF